MKQFIILLRREYWENKSLWLLPLCLTLIFIALGTYRTDSLLQLPTDFRLNDQPLDSKHLASALAAIILFLTSGILTLKSFFYALTAISDDRKDNSHLFWKALPIHHSSFVLSKLCIAMLTIGLAFFICLMVTNCIWLLNGHTLSSSIFNGAALSFLIKAQLLALLAAFPFIGWGLFVSATTRRNPMWLGIIYPIVVSILLPLFNLGKPVAYIWGAMTKPIMQWMGTLVNDLTQTMTATDVNEMNTHEGMLGFLIVGVALLCAAIWQYRKQS